MYSIYPKKYAHGFVVLCFVVVMQSFIMNSHEVFILIHQGCFAGTGAIVRLPQCQWRKPDGYVKISQCITTTKHSKAKTVCIFLGIYCNYVHIWLLIHVEQQLGIFQDVVKQFEISKDVLDDVQEQLGISQHVVQQLGIFPDILQAQQLGIFQDVLQVQQPLGIFQDVVQQLGLFQEVLQLQQLGIFQYFVQQLGIFQDVVRHLGIFQDIVQQPGIFQYVSNRLVYSNIF